MAGRSKSSSCFYQWRTVALLWCFASLLAFASIRLALHNASRPPSASPAASPSDLRAMLYDKLAGDLEANGALFLKGGETSQSLLLSDIFERSDGGIRPKLKAVDPPVRANVLYLRAEAVAPISQTIRDTFLPYFDKAIWFQNASLYHCSLFHASHHIGPIHASDAEVEAEANAVKSLANTFCPLKLILDRIVLTSTGVLLGCWQVVSGTDPSMIRTKLREVLPRAPQKQFYDPVILHTSLARILCQPKIRSKKSTDPIKFLHELVMHLNSRLHGFQMTASELWFVEELDMLALALNGRMKIHKFHLGCSKT